MRTARGFSLLEVMIAMAILAVGALGALAAVLGANDALREGQLRLQKQALIQATLQRARLANKERLYNSAVTVSAATMPPAQALGTAPWALDPTPPLAGDLSTGNLFFLLPDGSLRHCTSSTTPACTGIVSCADTAIPTSVFCREVVDTRSSPTWAPGGIVPAGTFVTTRWVRVVQKKKTAAETLDSAVLGSEAFAQ